jgi:hypothetical protein
MFEDIKKKDESIVVGNPAKVEDMFGKVDPAPDMKSAVQVGKLTPTASMPGAQAANTLGAKIGPPNPLTNLAQVDQWSKKRPRHGIKIFISVFIALLVTGAAVYYFFFRTPVISTSNTNANVNQPVAPVANENANQAVNAPTNALIDADGDGLTDVEEAAAGTDVNNVDTDSDGLSDRDELRVHKTNPLLADSDNDGLSDSDEIFIYKTNPNNPDTDGDTYQDGVEVQNGYNPNGEGKLPIVETVPAVPPVPPAANQ